MHFPGNVFGPILLAPQLENQVTATLKGFLSLYLAEVERRVGVDEGTYHRPRSWNVSPSNETFPGSQLPAVVVVCPGIEGEPERKGDGTYDAWFSVSVFTTVSTTDAKSSRWLAGMYAGAIRACILQNKSLAGLSDGIVWVDEGYAASPSGSDEINRTMGISQVVFRVLVRNVGQTERDQPTGLTQSCQGFRKTLVLIFQMTRLSR